MARLIPVGTGFEWYRQVRITADEPFHRRRRRRSRPRTISISIARSSTRSTPTSRCWGDRPPATWSRGVRSVRLQPDRSARCDARVALTPC